MDTNALTGDPATTQTPATTDTGASTQPEGSAAATAGGDGSAGSTAAAAAPEEGGALGASTQTPAEPEIDWEKMTDDDYIGKVKLPEGQNWNKDAMAKYAPLLRENKIDPKVFEKFVALDAEISKANADAAKAAEDKEMETARAAFRAAKDDFVKSYSPEQIGQMNDTLSKIDDETFRTLITKSPLANNKTMGKMLLAYRQVYGEDNAAGGGSSVGSERGFAEVWTGKRI